MGHDVLTRGDAPRVARRLPLAILLSRLWRYTRVKRRASEIKSCSRIVVAAVINRMRRRWRL